MVHVYLKCPNCRNVRGFNLWCVAEYRVKTPNLPAKRIARIYEGIKDGYKSSTPITAYGVAVCTGCQEAVLVKFDTGLKMVSEFADKCGTQEQLYGHKIKVLDYHPKPPEPVTHPAYPEKVRSEFVDLQNMVDEGKSSAFIVMGCRRVLELALGELEADGETLFKKIKDLQKKGALTKVLADWAHQIRLIGNEGAHVGDPADKEAEEMVDFIKVFLEYGFVLPHRIDRLRGVGEASSD